VAYTWSMLARYSNELFLNVFISCGYTLGMGYPFICPPHGKMPGCRLVLRLRLGLGPGSDVWGMTVNVLASWNGDAH